MNIGKKLFTLRRMVFGKIIEVRNDLRKSPWEENLGEGTVRTNREGDGAY